MDSVLGAGPELVGGSYDSVLRSDDSGAARLFSDNMLHGVDTIGSAFRFVVRQQSMSSPSASQATAVVTDLATHVFTRDASVRHATAQRTFHGETASPLSTVASTVAPPVATAAAHFDL